MTMQTNAGEPMARGRLWTAYGVVRLSATKHGLREVWLPRWTGIAQTPGAATGTSDEATGDASPGQIDQDGEPRACRHLEQALLELREYFAGARQQFDVALDPSGTEFLLQAWRAVAAVSYGQTRSYGEIAQVVGLPDAARAVGRANAINPLAPFVPCHRIVGSDGRLTGYGPGLPMKERLLRMEDALPDGASDYDDWVARLRSRAGLPTDAPVYLGIRRTHTYCLAGCERSRAHADLPGRIFTSAAEAAGAGYAPCPLCRANEPRGVPVAQGRLTFEGGS